MTAPTRCCRAVVDLVGAELVLSMYISPGELVAVLPMAPAEVAEHTARRKQVWEKRNSGKTFPTISRGRLGMPKGFAAETAEATGREKRTINEAE